jgi:hypothetical protein
MALLDHLVDEAEADKTGLDDLFFSVGAATATAAIGGYLLYRRFRKRSLPERSNRALPKGKV